MRFEVDHRNEEGQFILTGSAVPVSTEQIKHTGTGRFAWVLMPEISRVDGVNRNPGRVRKLMRSYARNQGGQVYHYRDRSGLECDAVIHLKNGNSGLVEIKLGGNMAV